MSEERTIIESLAMDLKRVALGLQRGSNSMALRFKKEALRRQAELEKQTADDYLKKLITKSRDVLSRPALDTYEDVLMYSVLFQNYIRKLSGG